MEQDELMEVLKDLPVPQKEVAEAYMHNVENIRKTTKIILNRDMDAEENSRFRLHCFNLAVTQVVMELKNKISESEEKDGNSI